MTAACDIADHANPRIVGGAMANEDAYSRIVVVAGSYVYLAGWSGPASFVVLPTQRVSSSIVGTRGANPLLAFMTVRPNPASGEAAIEFANRSAGRVEIGVYDVAGRLVRSMYAGGLAAGHQHLLWDSRDENGRAVPAGIYFVRASISGEASTARCGWSCADMERRLNDGQGSRVDR